MPPVPGICDAAGGGASGAPAPTPSYGVWGDCRNGPGVSGSSFNNNGARGASRNSAGVYGTSETRNGVYGYSPERHGVFGYGRRTGVYGFSEGFPVSDIDATIYSGLYGEGRYGSFTVGRDVGTYSRGTNYAGVFQGDVIVSGRLYVLQPPKAAVVPHPDGTRRALCAMESPESWFEDFGRAEVIDGHARVELDGDFAALVRTDDYHVFVTAEGESNGLYVSVRTERAFEVREQGNGTSSLTFSYRVAAKRKDIEIDRLEVVDLPPELTREFAPPELEADELEPPTEWKEWEPLDDS
jgi:hypothetical protein